MKQASQEMVTQGCTKALVKRMVVQRLGSMPRTRVWQGSVTLHKSVEARVGSEDAHEQGMVPSSRRFREPGTTAQGHSRSAQTSRDPADLREVLSGRGGNDLWGSTKVLDQAGAAGLAFSRPGSQGGDHGRAS